MRFRSRLAVLTLKQGDWQSTLGHLWQLLQLSPGELMKTPLRLRQLCRRLRRGLRPGGNDEKRRDRGTRMVVW